MFTTAIPTKAIVSLLFLMTVCTLDVFAQDKNKKEKICITEQEFAVYDAVGVRNFQNETTNYPFGYGVENQFPNISSEAVADYSDKNGKTYLLRCVLKQDQKKKKLKTSFGTTVNNGFSRIGFNKDGTEALVYMSWSGLGNTCESDFVYLKKENDKWQVVKKVMMVIC